MYDRWASVIIVTYNRARYCNELLWEIVKNQLCAPKEIVVVDNGSDEEFMVNGNVAEVAERKSIRIRLLRLASSETSAYARNTGMNVSSGETLAFIDDDALPDSNWLCALSKKHMEGYDIVGGLVLPLYMSKLPKWWNEEVLGHYVSVRNDTAKNIVGKVWAGNLSVRREVFEKIGFMNPRLGKVKGKLTGYEETEFIERAFTEGFKVAFESKAIVYHRVSPQRLTLNYVLKRGFYLGFSEALKDRVSGMSVGGKILRRVASIPYVLARTSYHLLVKGLPYTVKDMVILLHILGYLAKMVV